jgi:FKBP-type peptidyl-prolyl cis-trans isomerase FkpA
MRFRYLVILAFAAAVAACGKDTPTSPSVNANVPYSQVDVRVGTGTEAVNGRTATVIYALWLYDPNAAQNKGTSVPQPGNTFSFVVGGSGVIQGFNQMVTGMRVGGQRRAVIPPNLAYGAQGRPPEIPGNATLVFEVELTNVQ